MNTAEKLELLRLAKENVQLQRLMNKHEGYKDQIRTIRKRGVLTSREEQEIMALKFKKLRSKDQMIRLLRELKTGSSPTVSAGI